MTYLKNREQDARLAKLEERQAAFLALAEQLVAEHQALEAKLVKLEGLTVAHGVAQTRMKVRLKDLEGAL